MIKQSGMSKEIIERLGGVTGCVSIALGIGSSCFFYFLEEETLVSSLTYAVLASSLSYCVVYTIVSIFISDEVQENIILTKERDRLLNENEEILKRIKEAKDSLHKNIVRRSIKSVAYQMTIHNKRGDTSFKKVTKIVPKEPLKLIVGSIKTSSKNKFLFFDKKRGLKANIINDKGDKVSCITFPIEVENQRTQYIVIFPVRMESEFQLEITYTWAGHYEKLFSNCSDYFEWETPYLQDDLDKTKFEFYLRYSKKLPNIDCEVKDGRVIDRNEVRNGKLKNHLYWRYKPSKPYEKGDTIKIDMKLAS